MICDNVSAHVDNEFLDLHYGCFTHLLVAPYQ